MSVRYYDEDGNALEEEPDSILYAGRLYDDGDDSGIAVQFFRRTEEEAEYVSDERNAPARAKQALEDAAAARETADQALSDAAEAATVATNYLDFVTGLGLVVANMMEQTLGRNVLISAQDIKIRNGDTTLATFADSLIELGKNSSAAVIDLCDGTAQMKYDSATDIFYLISQTASAYVHGNPRAGITAQSGGKVAAVYASASGESVEMVAGATGADVLISKTGVRSNVPWPIYGKEFGISTAAAVPLNALVKVPFTSIKKTLPATPPTGAPTFNVQNNEIVCSANGTVMVTYSLWMNNVTFGDSMQSWVRILHANGTYSDDCMTARVVGSVMDIMTSPPTMMSVSAGDKIQVYVQNYSSGTASVAVNTTRLDVWYIG